MRQTKREFMFQKLQQFIHNEDHTSIAHVLQWEYRKDELFDLKNDEGLTLIHIACFEGQVKCLEEFLKKGASSNIQSSVGWTPLHAATLGGKLEVVEYLLAECSADPSAKDEMGCVPSDLTMDSEILKTINAFADELNLRKDLERIAGHEAANQMTPRKRNTFDFETIENGCTLSRAQSTLINSNEADESRENRILPIIGGGRNQSTYDNYSVTVEKTPTKTKTVNLKELDYQHRYIEQSSRSSGGSEQSSPRLTRYYDVGKRTPSLRDSGVFDDEPDMDSLTDQFIKKKLSSISQPEHYNMI